MSGRSVLFLVGLGLVDLAAVAYALRAHGEDPVWLVAAMGSLALGGVVAGVDPPPHEAAVLACLFVLSLDVPILITVVRNAEDDGFLTFLLLGVLRIVGLAAGFAGTHYVRFVRRHD